MFFWGLLGGEQDGTYLGIKLSEGSGDCDGTFNNVKYFHAPNNKGIFVPKDEVKQTISGEVKKTFCPFLPRAVPVRFLGETRETLILSSSKVFSLFVLGFP